VADDAGRMVDVEGNIDHEKLNVAAPVEVLVGIKPKLRHGVVFKLKLATGACAFIISELMNARKNNCKFIFILFILIKDRIKK
jgi:hypothetical protein